MRTPRRPPSETHIRSYILDTAFVTLVSLGILTEKVQAADLPSGEAIAWGHEPLEVLSSTRGQLVLNGIWRFAPASEATVPVRPESDWGFVRVPGNWQNEGPLRGVLARGDGPAWKSFEPTKAAAAWYERTIQVPEGWVGRRIELALDRVSTDAIVFVDGKRAGSVCWPGGIVDLTSVATPGHQHVLSILVLASDDQKEILQFMESATAQVSKVAAKLESRGLVGDVYLRSKPTGPAIRDLVIRTSTRNHQLSVGVALEGIRQPGKVQLKVSIQNTTGIEQKRFTAEAEVGSGDIRQVTACWDWRDPKLWDVGTPNLYRLVLNVHGSGVDDEIKQDFGFREFWIDGKDFYLNGTKIRLRPTVAPTSYNNTAGVVECIAGTMRSARDAGFNFMELWPADMTRRGTENVFGLWYSAADREGMLVSGVATSMNRQIVDNKWQVTWEKNKPLWQREMQRELTPLLNHPSIVMWGTSANFFGDSDDQNPRSIGRHVYKDTAVRVAGRDGIALMKRFDPTRPVFTHQGADVGDVQATNTYLGFLPLQEREAWLSHWAGQGEIPFIAVEFGTPFFTNFHRGRNGFGGAVTTEPLWSEYSAIYLGPHAYEVETPDYRKEIPARFKEQQVYASWHANNEVTKFSPANMELQSLFIRNTWRAWRTWGISGGMIPWDNAYAWQMTPSAREKISLGQFNPGRLGNYMPVVSRSSMQPYGPPGPQWSPAGQVLRASNSETLAWIAGAAPDFTEKRHQYWPGDIVQKQIVLLNDDRIPQPYNMTWTALLDGKSIASESLQGELSPAQTLLLPIHFNLPQTFAPKSEGKILLTGTIGSTPHRDSFPFRVYARPMSVALPKVAIVDPLGKTTEFLARMQVATFPWDRKTTSASVIAVGREAFSRDPSGSLPAQIDAFVSAGGTAIVFEQTPEYLQRYVGWRVAPYVSRRVYPLARPTSVLEKFDETDLRDWSAISTLVEPFPDRTGPNNRRNPNGLNYYGDHWGNQGMVTSAPIEKPHHSGWRPLLECEFDLAYTPLMELQRGRGRVILCQLDLEDQAAATPAAHLIAARLLEYASATRKAPTVVRTIGINLATDEVAMLRSMSVQFNSASEFGERHPADELIILGRETTVREEQLRAFVDNGGRALVLAGRTRSRPLGVAIDHVADIPTVPPVPDWPEAAGLSTSDLRTRAPGDYLVLQPSSGLDVSAGGLLGRMAIGRGVALYTQLDPGGLDADTKTYFRLTRWRYTRALAQILANLGATFSTDDRFFNPFDETASDLSLAGAWRAKWVNRIPDPTGKATNDDPGTSASAAELLRTGVDDHTWVELSFPGMWDSAGPTWSNANGEAVVRKHINIPPTMAGKDLVLSLGAIDDRDVTTFNGTIVGQSPAGTASQYSTPRRYSVPGRLVHSGDNLIAIRIWDSFGGGGISGTAADMVLRPDTSAIPGFYHLDYRADFELGDDPYRYFRW